MVWVGFTANGTTPIVSTRGSLNSTPCVDMLIGNVLLEASLITDDHYLFH